MKDFDKQSFILLLLFINAVYLAVSGSELPEPMDYPNIITGRSPI